jgi:hypothetical protein
MLQSTLAAAAGAAAAAAAAAPGAIEYLSRMQACCRVCKTNTALWRERFLHLVGLAVVSAQQPRRQCTCVLLMMVGRIPQRCRGGCCSG